jgi:uncharacterized heparinase superfamily protein
VEVDGELQCRVFTRGRAIYSIINESRPRCTGLVQEGDVVRVTACHCGYRWLPGGGDHERTIEFHQMERCWRIVDRLALRGSHRCIWRFHLHPDVEVRRDSTGWLLRHGPARARLRARTANLEERLEEGQLAPGYGLERTSHVLVWSYEGVGPVEVEFAIEVGGEDD